MFGDNSFSGIEDLFNQLSGGREYVGTSNKRSATSESLLSAMDVGKKKFLIFDFSGKDVVSVKIEEDLEVNEYGEEEYTGNKILKIIYNESKALKYVLPKGLHKRKIRYTVLNGILEVILEK